MAKSLVVFSLLFLLLLLLISPLTADPNIPNPKPSPSPAHTDLTNYGFPIGLLPSAVKNYTINRTTGDFIVELGGACKVTLPSDNVATYSKKITGKIVVGKITKINGISVRALFRWQPITGIRSSGDNLVFEIGTVSVKYPTKNFDESPACEGRHSS
ncbi:uncharacterized protein LOC103929405 [Pyrus x bretschneideri]|uniref:uncharacterized protein LOC103929405 n=1 Tax=Pyrus x bretschneideri TaxID=225117 RepID=UPI00202F6CBE|nr:uncharacterized protein LOC103929405 [Pyrus x bretschneideri]